MMGPPAKATSMRTESDGSGNGYDLRENAVNGVGMDKGDLQTEQADARDGVDELDAVGGEARENRPHVVDLVREVVNAGASPREEASHGRVLIRWCEQLDAAGADEDGRSLDTLLGDPVAVLEDGAKGSDVRLDSFVEVEHGDSDVVKALGVHLCDATARRPGGAAAGRHR